MQPRTRAHLPAGGKRSSQTVRNSPSSSAFTHVSNFSSSTSAVAAAALLRLSGLLTPSGGSLALGSSLGAVIMVELPCAMQKGEEEGTGQAR